jgi:hypothetical protein
MPMSQPRNRFNRLTLRHSNHEAVDREKRDDSAFAELSVRGLSFACDLTNDDCEQNETLLQKKSSPGQSLFCEPAGKVARSPLHDFLGTKAIFYVCPQCDLL